MSVRDDLVRIIDDALGEHPRTALLAYQRLTSHELPWLEQRVVMHARAAGWNWATIALPAGRCSRARWSGARRGMFLLAVLTFSVVGSTTQPPA